jgi:LCP family protein required for cell wall assembly
MTDEYRHEPTLDSESEPTIPLPYTLHAEPVPPPVTDRALQPRTKVRRSLSGGRSAWGWVALSIALFGVMMVGSLVALIALRSTQANGEAFPTEIAALPTPVDARIRYDDPAALLEGESLQLDDGRSIALEKWNGTSRFTILVMGLDRRAGETGLGFRTDTMMLASLDPATQTLGLLSIPRDLYVEVPGYSALQRVNSAMVLGELQEVGYGPVLAMQTIQYNLGVRVHDYVAIDFEAAMTLVDALGGIDIDVPYDIADYEFPDMSYGYDPLLLRAGLQHMNGYTALKYARTRHNDSDFERARRQQQVLFAVRERVLDVDALPQLVLSAPALFTSLRDNLYTGMTIEQIIQMGLYLTDVPVESIRTGVIDSDYVMDYLTEDGAAVLIPNRARLSLLLEDVFGDYSD